MMRLRSSELRRFSTTVDELSAEPAPKVALSEHLLRAIARLVPVDRVSYNEVNRDTGQVVLAHSMGELPAPGLVSSLNTHIREHPGFYQPDRGSDWPAPTKISDFLSQRQFRQLGLYQDHFRLYGIHYQLGIAFGVDEGHTISFGLNRARLDFPEEARTLLTLLRPHLARVQARTQAMARLRSAVALRDAALDAVAVVLLDRTGNIVFCSAQARAAFERIFPLSVGSRHRGEVLPAPLAHWIGQQSSSIQPEAGSARRLCLRRENRKLLVEFVFGDVYHLLRLTERPAEPTIEPLRTLGLTERETEVLLWLAQGKRNAEIALICRLHPMTVSTHVRNLLAKLHCETRTAAAALAWEKLGEIIG